MHKVIRHVHKRHQIKPGQHRSLHNSGAILFDVHNADLNEFISVVPCTKQGGLVLTRCLLIQQPLYSTLQFMQHM